MKSLFVLLVLATSLALHSCQNDTTTLTTTTSTTTTTPAPITTSTTTTTPAPITTSTTVAPEPTPKPHVDLVSGNLTDKANHTCLRYEFAAVLQVQYESGNQTETATFALPSNVKLSHSDDACSSPTLESFNLTSQDDKLVFTLEFKSNDNSVFLDRLGLIVNTVNNSWFPNATESELRFNLTEINPNFNVDKTHSYACASNVTVPHDATSKVHVIFSSLRVQAFMDKENNGTFSEEHNCLNEINDVVPIAVGCALTGLVVIVLIAYFIGRRRSRRQAYQSV